MQKLSWSGDEIMIRAGSRRVKVQAQGHRACSSVLFTLFADLYAFVSLAEWTSVHLWCPSAPPTPPVSLFPYTCPKDLGTDVYGGAVMGLALY